MSHLSMFVILNPFHGYSIIYLKSHVNTVLAFYINIYL